ncbi:hypothetical protein [Marinicrinis sediminis]|uniref:Uncharacterized protein n=1 Tax=Marinicrinis sediminis TaxID=1652465 RepID=A0ABW5RB41_9BACL
MQPTTTDKPSIQCILSVMSDEDLQTLVDIAQCHLRLASTNMGRFPSDEQVGAVQAQIDRLRAERDDIISKWKGILLND